MAGSIIVKTLGAQFAGMGGTSGRVNSFSLFGSMAFSTLVDRAPANIDNYDVSFKQGMLAGFMPGMTSEFKQGMIGRFLDG